MPLPGGPPLSPSLGCRSAAILRAEQIRRHCQRDAATPRAAVPERVPILATLILLDADPKAPGSIHLAPPRPCRAPLATCKASGQFRQGCNAHFEADEKPTELAVLRPRYGFLGACRPARCELGWGSENARAGDPSPTISSLLIPGTSLCPASAAERVRSFPIAVLVRVPITSRSKPLCALQHCLGTCGF